jgi:hypothetical protein
MSTEFLHQPHEPVTPPPAQTFPPPWPQQGEAVDWAQPPWPPAPTEQIPSYDGAPAARPPLDTVSLFALITAVPGLGLVSVPLGIWGVIRTKNHQRRGRSLAVIGFVLIGLWAIVGAVAGLMAALAATSSTERTAAPPPTGLVAPTTVPATVSAAPLAPSTIPGHQPHGPLRKAKMVYWEQLETGYCVKGMSEKYTYTVTRVDCRSPHQAEVTGTFNLRGSSRYPGDAAVEAASDARCEKYFARYVGIGWDSSAYNYDYVTPEPSDWRQGDREVICMAVDPAHPEDSRISLRNVKE